MFTTLPHFASVNLMFSHVHHIITLVNVKAPVVATTSWWLHFSAPVVVKGKKNLYLLTLLFIYKPAFILYVMTPGAQTTGNIAVYGSAKQLVI